MEGMQASTSHEMLFPDKKMQQTSSFTQDCPSSSQALTSSKIVPLTDEDVRQTCYAYANEFNRYGTRFIQDAILTDIQNDCAFHYKLQTLAEKRETAYKGSIHKAITSHYVVQEQATNVTENADFADPWNVPVNTEDGTLDFADFELVKPGPVSLRDCEICLGKKGRRCFNCWGSEKVPCQYCKGTGKKSLQELCRSCDGKGTKLCYKCLFKGGETRERGTFKCKTCKGNGKMMYEKQLIITRKVHVDYFISDSSNLPTDLIQEADGQELFSKRSNRVEPLTLYVNREVNEASSALIEKRNLSLTDEKIVAQRHSLRAIPYTKVSYTWRNKKGEFFIYGLQKKIYIQDYPQQSLCVCF